MTMPSNMRIDGGRLITRLMDLAAIGATPEGGCRRLALSDEDRQGRDWLVAQMRALDLDVRIDQIGNIAGIMKGVADGPAILIGSHIDTVASGGKYDGAYGVISGLEVIAALRDAKIMPPRDLAVMAFTNEEGARFQPDMFGSCVWAGRLPLDDARQSADADGFLAGEELRRIGYEGPEKPGFLQAHAYLELHIEQGPVLDSEGGGIGAVTGVQGITWLEVTLEGQPNHAGTTPMTYRRDAGLAAARINLRAHEITQGVPGQLANMGFFRVEPNNVNVVPERVVATLDLRNPHAGHLAQAEKNIRDYMTGLEKDGDIKITIRDLARFAPTPFSEHLIGKVEAAAKSLNLPVRRMISGAGHDAQMMAPLCPTAMIFVPSVGGLSHNPKELTQDA
ncbi:MAG: Zn-dependent hydrolase, partial [Beijerinckiaceae bacterium]